MMQSLLKGVFLAGALVSGVLVAAETPRVLGHRGNFQYDDNALGGFRQSLEAGVTGFELDVHMTQDGGMVVMHDSAVSTTTTATSGMIESMTLDAVTNLVLKRSGEHVPSLQQVVDLFGSRADLFVEFEMKAEGSHTGEVLKQYVDNTYAIVAGTMAAGTYVFTSFSTDYLAAMKQNHPDAPIGLIVDSALTQAQIESATALGCLSIAPLATTTAEMVAAAHAAGLRVTLWMVDDFATWKECRAKGADATTSNQPIPLIQTIAPVAEPGMIASGYQRLESIQSTGEQWLDTGVRSASDVEVELDMQVLSVGQGSTCFFGERMANGKHFALWIQQNTHKIAINYGGNDSNYTYADAPSFSMRHVFRNVGSDIVVDDRTYYHPESYKEFSASTNLCMFVIRQGDGILNRQACIRLWRLKIWKAGVLVRDLVPCRNPLGEAGLYDLADHAGETGYMPFYENQGTGAFVTTEALPDDYVRQGYIESHGTEWIDTGVTSSSDIEVEMDMQFLSVGQGSSCFFGERVTKGKHFALWAQQTTHKVAINNGDIDSGYNYANAPSFSTRKVFSNKKADIYVDGVRVYQNDESKKAFASFSNDQTLYLFVMRNTAGGGFDNRNVRLRLFSLRIWKGGTLVRDFVPCYDPNGVLGLYDLAVHAEGDAAGANRFYANQGSGTFAAGVWMVEPSLSLTKWEVGSKRTAKINWGRTLGVPVTCSHTEEELAALPEGRHTVTFTAGLEMKSIEVEVYRPFVCTPSADGRTASFTFPSAAAVRTLTVGCGQTDSGTNPASWTQTFTVSVPANATQLGDVALPEGFGAAFEQRVLRGFMMIDGQQAATPLAVVEGPVLVRRVGLAGGVPAEADLVFSPSHQVRGLYVAWARKDAGAEAMAWSADGVNKVCDIPANIATKTITFPDAARALFRSGGQFRFFLENTYLPPNYQAIEYVGAIGSQGIDTGVRPGPTTACEADFIITYDVMDSHVREFVKDVFVIPQMRVFTSRAGIEIAQIGNDDLVFETYVNGSGKWAYGLFDGSSNGTVHWQAISPSTDVLTFIRLKVGLDALQRKCFLNGEDRTPSGQANISVTKVAPTTLHLMNGANESTGGSYNFRGHFYGATIKENDVPVRSFVPSRNPDGYIGLFDRVEKRFYESDGILAFSAGPNRANACVASLPNGLPSEAAVSDAINVNQMTLILVR